MINRSQVIVGWTFALILAAGFGVAIPEPEGTVRDVPSTEMPAALSGEDRTSEAIRLAGSLGGLLDPATRQQAASGAVTSTEPAADITPQVLAIVTERGASRVLVREETGAVEVGVGETWRDWTLDRILPTRAVFTKDGKEYEIAIFSSTP
jgi:hypothetical protein